MNNSIQSNFIVNIGSNYELSEISTHLHLLSISRFSALSISTATYYFCSLLADSLFVVGLLWLVLVL